MGRDWPWRALGKQKRGESCLQAGAVLRGGLSSCLAHLEHSHAAINESNNLQYPDTHAPSRCLLRSHCGQQEPRGVC